MQLPKFHSYMMTNRDGCKCAAVKATGRQLSAQYRIRGVGEWNSGITPLKISCLCAEVMNLTSALHFTLGLLLDSQALIHVVGHSLIHVIGQHL